MILSLLRKDPVNQKARALYEEIVAAARAPAIFADGGAPDTVEGRFEVLSIHLYLVLRRLKGEGEAARRFSQALLDTFFRNMDDSLRELGVGDLSVGKRIRRMAEAFYGRAGAYEKAFAREDEALAAALARNVYAAAPKDAPGSSDLARYMRAADRRLRDTDYAAIEAGRVSFPAFEAQS